MRKYSYSSTAFRFIAGALVTAVFAASLAPLTTKAEIIDVLVVGMIVPSFTWVAQLTTAAATLTGEARRAYSGDLASACVWGSIALLPAAFYNLSAAIPVGWVSVANVLFSVAMMAGVLFCRTACHDIPPAWPSSWCLTISLNMALFLLASRAWWR